MSGTVVSQAERIEASKALLAKEEKLMLRAADDLSAARRRLSMVMIDKTYKFTTAESQAPLSLNDLFDGMYQLIVYHFMFSSDDERGCRGCTHVPALCAMSAICAHGARSSSAWRAAPEKLDAFKAKCGWEFLWYSTAADTSNELQPRFCVSANEHRRGVMQGSDRFSLASHWSPCLRYDF